MKYKAFLFWFVISGVVGFGCSGSQGDESEQASQCNSETGEEITEETPLLADDGTLAAHGWARKPYMQYDPAKILGDLKEDLRVWEVYTVLHRDFSFEMTVMDVGTVSLVNTTLADYKTNETYEQQSVKFDDIVLPNDPFGDTTTSMESEGSTVSYDYGDGTRSLTLSQPNAAVTDEVPAVVEADITIEDSPARESVAVTHKFSTPGRFFYENKRTALPAQGSVEVTTASGTKTYSLGDKAFAVLDWGRGTWPSTPQWERAYFTGTVDGHQVGINLGSVFADDSKGTANAIVVDGIVHKLGEVTWEYNRDDVMQRWRFTSSDGRLDVVLSPDYDGSSDVGLEPSPRITSHEAHGYVTGTIKLDDCTTLDIKVMRGVAEFAEIRW